jgi:hypothetical protein
MNVFPRLSALLLLSAVSVTLFACSAPASGTEAAEVTAAAAQPLLESCEGTYTRQADDGQAALSIELESAHGVCKAGDLHLGGDHTVTIAATGKSVAGSWAGDSHTFVVCSAQHCFQWQKSIASAEQ